MEKFFDNWYLSKDFVLFLRTKNLHWIPTLKSDTIFSMLKIYEDSKEKRCIWGANFGVKYVNGRQKIVVSKPDLCTRI